MKTTFSALKLWLAVIILSGLAVGCAKKNDSFNGGRPGQYGNYPGGYPPGTVAPGGLLKSAAGRVSLSEGLQVDMELFFMQGTSQQCVTQPCPNYGGSATVEGRLRMNMSDFLCQIWIPHPIDMQVIPQQSQVMLSGTDGFQVVQGRLAVQGPNGIFFVGIDARFVAKSSGPAIGAITGQQFPYYLRGSAQPGSCQNSSMMTDWPLIEM